MPAYSAGPPPPMSLQPGGVGYSFGSLDPLAQVETLEVIPAAATAGARFALTQPEAAVDPGSRTITYETEFDSAPSALSVSLQVAMRDADADYVTIDTNTASLITNIKSVTGIRALFVRLILNSITANAATKMAGKILA